ncbi:hypothetical protein [Xanthomonas arboricola]|uniref:hypothetical protein n=1 Tax=Xanthomonas arboricola TaxID=56448 RepID=UPI000CEEB7DC|nr:hypothetical protein [Xanthomonas arboricola]PPT53122.1 hypothetical protein XarbCFBP8147_04425 [Xanthomonas arboricola]
MTHHFIPAALLVLTACAYLRGLLGYLRYAKQRRFDEVDANYRAACLVANAKRDMRVSRVHLYTTKPDGRLDTVISAPSDGWRESTAEDLRDASEVAHA